MIYPSLKEISFQIKTLFHPQSVAAYQKIRIGSEGDGGYVMLDDFTDIRLAVSGGIGGNDDWERAMSSRTKVIAHDPFDDEIVDRTYEFRNERLVSLNALLKDLPDYSVIGKIDIEGDEFDLFKNTDPALLRKFRQLVCEIHLQRVILDQTQLESFAKLNAVFNTIHIHGNNTAEVFVLNGIKVPKVFEITLANKDCYVYSDFVGKLPGELDRPCDPNREEIILLSD